MKCTRIGGFLAVGLLVAACADPDDPWEAAELAELAELADVEDEPPGPGQPGPAVVAPGGTRGPSSDPAYNTVFQVCSSDESNNGTDGRIFFPSSHPTSCSQQYVPSGSPVVVLTHGNGFGYDEYDEILSHLAANGFFAISVEADTASQTSPANYIAVAESVVEFVDYVDAGLPIGAFIDFDAMGLIGHSRGGELASYIAQELYTRPDRTVKATVAMAPQNDTEPYIYGYMSPAYMVMYGGADGDVPIEHAYRHHDWAGFNEWSSLYNPWGLHRSMKFFSTMAHGCYSDRNVFSASCPTRREKVRGYLNAFLLHHVAGDDSFYEAYIRGNDYPGNDSADVWTQYSDNDQRRVIDNFERFDLSPSHIGGTVVTSSKMNAFTVDASVATWSPHSTYGLMMWPSGAGGYVRWDIPAGSRDATAEKYLSFRIASAYGDTPGAVKVWLRNGGTYTWVYLANYLDVPSFPTQGRMATVRIPLSAFGAHNDVRSIYVQFSDGADAWETYLMDSLEFSEPA